MSESFFYEGLVVLDFDPYLGDSIEMPWRSSYGKNEELTSAVALETLGVDPYTEDLEPKTISVRARITVEIL